MRRRKRTRKVEMWFTFLFVFCCAIGIGYAFLASTLVVDGTANIGKAVWDVHYENVNVTTGSVEAATPEILDDTTIKYTVSLSEPGQFYEFDFDVVNAGTMDAVIDKVVETNLSDAQKKYLTYSLSYIDGTSVKVGDELLKTKSKKLKVRIEFKTDVEEDDLPTEADEVKMKLQTEYIQKGSTAPEEGEDTPGDDETEIDDSKYWDCGDAKIDGYKCLKLTWTPERFWDSTKAATSGPDKSDAIGNQYWSTQIIEKSEIPNGSIISIAKKWSYRPEGWQSLNVKNANPRPAGTGATTTTVDDIWWNDYNYRAFNVYNGSDISGYTDEQINEVFHIYIPINQ